MFKTSNKYSNAKLAWFPHKMDSLRLGYVTPPIYVRIKPINRCCHKCFFCVYNADFSAMHETMQQTDMLSKEKLFQILDDFKEMEVKAVTYSGGGEPLLHPDIVDVLEKTKTNGIDLSILTNGQLLMGERAKSLYNAKWVRVSMDYTNAQQFMEFRGGTEKQFYQILENIENFTQHKSSACDLSVNFIITDKNYKSIVDAAKLLKHLSVDNVRFSPVWIIDFLKYHKPIEADVLKNLEIARQTFQSENFQIYDSYKIVPEIMSRSYAKCYIMQTIPVIGADGFVYSCHNKAYSQDGIIGSIKDRRFKDLWYHSDTLKRFNEFNPQICCNCQCANDKKNILLHELINAYGDNFV